MKSQHSRGLSGLVSAVEKGTESLWLAGTEVQPGQFAVASGVSLGSVMKKAWLKGLEANLLGLVVILQ